MPYRRLGGRSPRRPGGPLMHPVFFGSAVTGAGVDALIDGIAELLPAAVGDADGPVSGTVFKVERGAAAEKVAYVRLFSGTVRVRDRFASRRRATNARSPRSRCSSRVRSCGRDVGRRPAASGSSGVSATCGSATASECAPTTFATATTSRRRRSRRSSCPRRAAEQRARSASRSVGSRNRIR